LVRRHGLDASAWGLQMPPQRASTSGAGGHGRSSTVRAQGVVPPCRHGKGTISNGRGAGRGFGASTGWERDGAWGMRCGHESTGTSSRGGPRAGHLGANLTVYEAAASMYTKPSLLIAALETKRRTKLV
jgi:hypothetical protein